MSNKNSIHIFGCNYPSGIHLFDLLSKNKDSLNILNIYRYSRNHNKENNKYFYDDLLNNFKKNDIIFSFIPINFTYKYIKDIFSKNLNPSKVFVLSSSSIYSKVINKSKDSNDYLSFLIYENKILQLLLPILDSQHKLFLIRPTLIWGGKIDRNIHFIYKFLYNYRFFPLIKSSCGLRAPLHHNQLALKLYSLMKLNLNSGIYNFQGPCTFSYLEMVRTIQKIIPRKTIIIKLPKYFLIFLLKISELFKINSLISKISMILRQSEDLIYNEEKKINIESKDLGNFKEYISYTYQ